jgi:hypothetical protein
MSSLIDRLRGMWDGLNDRERLLVGALGGVAVFCVLGFPLLWTVSQNSAIREENAALRGALALIEEHRAELEIRSEMRRTAASRYTHKTPPLGSFLEGEAVKQGLTIREVTDQPEKAFGNYHRRGVSASINEAGLTSVMNLLSALASSPYPLAMDLIQIEHYQAGDTYRLKLGVLTYDRTASGDDDTDADKNTKPKSPLRPTGG